MARADLLSILYTKKMSALEFHFESLTAPSLYSMINETDIQYLRSIMLDPKLVSKPHIKQKLISKFMETRNFKKMVSGTNRICFKSYTYPDIVLKVAIDEVGLKDNPAEYRNQNILKPFVCKCFEMSRGGEVGLFERVEPITSRQQFASIASDVFDLLNKMISGKYILEDVGSNYFLNYGIRKGFGPVLLDYTYVYELDNNKLICNNKDQYSPTGYCMGEIDYDLGFNNLICEKCGKRYLAIQLKKDVKENKIIIKNDNGGLKMKITVKKGNEVIKEKELGRSIKQVDFIPKKSTVTVTFGKDGNVYKETKENDIVTNNTVNTEPEVETASTPIKTVLVTPSYPDPLKDKYKNNRYGNNKHRNKNNQNNNQQNRNRNNNKSIGRNDPGYYDQRPHQNNDGYKPKVNTPNRTVTGDNTPVDRRNTNMSVQDMPKLDNLYQAQSVETRINEIKQKERADIDKLFDAAAFQEFHTQNKQDEEDKFSEY